MKVLIALVTLASTLLVEGQLSMNNPNYCYSSDPVRPQNGMHSTQASYEAIRRPSVDTSVSCELIRLELRTFPFNEIFSACTPSRFWFVSRHGGRFPNAPSLLGIIELTNGPVSWQVKSHKFPFQLSSFSFKTTSSKTTKLVSLHSVLLTSTCWETGSSTHSPVLRMRICWLHRDVILWNLWLSVISNAILPSCWTLTIALNSGSVTPTGKEAKEAFEPSQKDFSVQTTPMTLSLMFHRKTHSWDQTTSAQLSTCTPVPEKRMHSHLAPSSERPCRRSTKSLDSQAPIS